MALKLQVVIISTRPGRVGLTVGRWFHEFAVGHGKFDVDLIDLVDFDLPLYDEPQHPTLQKYEHGHTKKWAASVASADAYVFVLPEYNYNPPPSFYNALNYVYKEWNYKPAGFCSYGGVSGGIRAAQMAKQLVTTLKMMPMTEGVMIPGVGQLLGDDGRFTSNALIDKSATIMLDEMLKWANALKSIRA